MTLQLIRKHKILYVIIFVFFLLSFNLNVFGVGLKPNWFDGFDPSSEEMTHRTISCASDGDYKGGLVNINPEGKDYCKVYPSQFGLQGYIYGGLGKIFPGDNARARIIQASEFALTAFLSVILLLFVAFCHIRYGKSVAVITAWLMMTSVWLVGYANQMYWVTFTFFLPFIVTLLLYPTLKTNKKKWIVFWVILFACFLLKFLNGYEYLVATSLSAVIPIIYWEMQKTNWSMTRIVMMAGKTVALSVAAFILAITTHIVSMADDYGSISNSIEAVKGRGEARSALGMRESFPSTVYNFIDMQPELYELIDKRKDMDVLYDNKASAATYIALMAFSYMALPVISLPIELTGITDVILESFVFWVLAAFLSIIWLRRSKNISKNEARAHVSVLLVGLAGIVSWHILFTGHALVHEHMVGISYYMPTLLWVYLTVAIFVTNFLKNSIARAKTIAR